MCPGKGLADFNGDRAHSYWLMRDAASQGSLDAMVALVHLYPPPFTNKAEMSENAIMRGRFAEVVADHYEAVRNHLNIASQAGFPTAFLESARLYAFSGIVDPNQESQLVMHLLGKS